jgi:hypothetical protein
MFIDKHLKMVRHLILVAVVWCLWSLRNKIIFPAGVADCVVALVSQIKLVSWVWFVGGGGRNANLLVVT